MKLYLKTDSVKTGRDGTVLPTKLDSFFFFATKKGIFDVFMALSAMQKLVPNSLASRCTSRKGSFTNDTGKLPFYMGHVESGKSAFPYRSCTPLAQTKPSFIGNL